MSLTPTARWYLLHAALLTGALALGYSLAALLLPALFYSRGTQFAITKSGSE